MYNLYCINYNRSKIIEDDRIHKCEAMSRSDKMGLLTTQIENLRTMVSQSEIERHETNRTLIEASRQLNAKNNELYKLGQLTSTLATSIHSLCKLPVVGG